MLPVFTAPWTRSPSSLLASVSSSRTCFVRHHCVSPSYVQCIQNSSLVSSSHLQMCAVHPVHLAVLYTCDCQIVLAAMHGMFVVILHGIT